MFFTCTPLFPNSPNVAGKIQLDAAHFLAMYELMPSDKQLDDYLKQKYGAGLVACCLFIVKKAKYSRDFNENIIISFLESKINNMAKEITFGNGVISGSRILVKAFATNNGA